MNPLRSVFGPTRVLSPRKLPTDHDYAASTREYQSDQPSRQASRPPLALPSRRNKSNDEEKQLLVVDRSFHIRDSQYGQPRASEQLDCSMHLEL
jgi:hypothetical protein